MSAASTPLIIDAQGVQVGVLQVGQVDVMLVHQCLCLAGSRGSFIGVGGNACSLHAVDQREGRKRDGSTGLPWRRISKCSFTRSASVLPISAIFWPLRTFWSSLTSKV